MILIIREGLHRIPQGKDLIALLLHLIGLLLNLDRQGINPFREPLDRFSGRQHGIANLLHDRL